MWNKEVQICKQGKLIGPSQAGGDLFDTAIATATDLFVHHGLPSMVKKAVEMGRYYGSEALRNPKLRGKSYGLRFGTIESDDPECRFPSS